MGPKPVRRLVELPEGGTIIVLDPNNRRMWAIGGLPVSLLGVLERLAARICNAPRAKLVLDTRIPSRIRASFTWSTAEGAERWLADLELADVERNLGEQGEGEKP